MVVEAAIDFSNGANREMWRTYRWRMSDNISPWGIGGFFVEEQATSAFNTGAVRHERWEGELNTESERHEDREGPGAMEESGPTSDDEEYPFRYG
jgi:hypothetical protein